MQTNDPQGDPSDHFTENWMTQSDHDRHEARVLGEAKPQAAWILTDRDVWHKNPYYTGAAEPHPEDPIWELEGAEFDAALAAFRAREGTGLTRQAIYLAQMGDFVANGYHMTDDERAALARLNE